MNITFGKKSPEDFRMVVALRDQFGRTVKQCKLHRCKTPTCQAQTSNDFCAKCVTLQAAQREERVVENAVELLGVSYMLVDVALMAGEWEEEMLNGVPGATSGASIPKGILHA